MARRDAFVVALFGSRGSGKSAAAKEYLRAAAPPRLLVWDTMDEYGEHAKRAPELVPLLEAGQGGKPFALRYVPSGTDDAWRERFDTFCAIAYALGDLVLVVEELQRVTRPAWAPASWSDCTLRGRHRNIAVVGLSQRPASVDKNFFSNASTIRSGRLNFADDVQCMANVLGVSAERVRNLRNEQGQGWARCGYLQREMASGEVTEGVLEIGKRPARAEPKRAVKTAASVKKR